VTIGGEVGTLRRVVVKHARTAFADPDEIARDWKALNFTAPPDANHGALEYDGFLEHLKSTGAEVLALPADSNTTLDSIYVRDASLVTPHGMVLCRMGKAERATEPAAQRRIFEAWGLPIAGVIAPPGGDVIWLDDRTVAIGRGYRTNDAGISQFRDLLGTAVDEVIVVPLPHWRGQGDVFHLMSIISPVDHDLAVVYSPLMPVPFREMLAARGIQFIEVPQEEFDSMGANVLALAPRTCLMLKGNPVTQARLEAEGARVRTYAGTEISIKGGGGPTCLTRPLERGWP
jgi:N-dimethylarginine dimethylaminohydrolase